ncbi:MAG: TIGR02281 family clan AA aspartic protease [Alphaproteobacteria bacterium]|nr:TIGR02281 family clan AA aspartic protease [Alphaproteobacteria bacterium]
MHFNDLTNSDWQNFIYLALILVVLISSVFSRRNLEFTKILKYLAIWAGIGFVVIALYAYRFEFADFKSRIVGEINPSRAQVNKDGEMVINLASDGHFYLDSKINSVPVRFMIDTGASDVVLSLSEAKRVGIDVTKLHFNKAYQTANGTSFGATILLDELEIAGVKFYDVFASVNSAPMGISLLGMSFLRRFKKYEFYQDRLVLVVSR